MTNTKHLRYPNRLGTPELRSQHLPSKKHPQVWNTNRLQEQAASRAGYITLKNKGTSQHLDKIIQHLCSRHSDSSRQTQLSHSNTMCKAAMLVIEKLRLRTAEIQQRKRASNSQRNEHCENSNTHRPHDGLDNA